MGLKLSAVLLLAAALLAGCARSPEASSQPEQFIPLPEQSAAASDRDEPAGITLTDDPASPYPMVVENWTLDLDGDGADELVELRAEKAYTSGELGADQWFEVTDYGLHPYTVVVTKGGTVYELPLGRENNDRPILAPWYFSPEDSEYTGACWTTDRSGNPVLALWFDTISAGGAVNSDIYAVAFQNGEPAFLPVPIYGIQATPVGEAMTSQVTVPETGYTETLDLMEWLEAQTKRNREHGHDFTFKPHYDEDGTLTWPAAPGNIDGYCYAEQAEEGILLKQYIWGSAHVDGMGFLVTNMSWENGEAVVLDQHFDWD